MRPVDNCLSPQVWRGAGGALQAWAEQQDIALLYIELGNPQQNANKERYNRTVRYA